MLTRSQCLRSSRQVAVHRAAQPRRVAPRLAPQCAARQQGASAPDLADRRGLLLAVSSAVVSLGLAQFQFPAGAHAASKKDIVATAYAKYFSGDLAGFAEMCAPDFKYITCVPKVFKPVYSLGEMGLFSSDLTGNFDIKKFDTREMVEEGNTVNVTVDEIAIGRKTGKTVNDKWTQRFTFSPDGKIISLQDICDSAKWCAAAGV